MSRFLYKLYQHGQFLNRVDSGVPRKNYRPLASKLKGSLRLVSKLGGALK